jgi:GNAT superfamily N-acetyltransferase
VKNIPVREITKDEVDRAAVVLGAAFVDDPLIQFAQPDLEARRVAMPKLARGWIRYGQLYGKTWVTPGLEGVAVRRRPGDEMGFWHLLRAGMLNMYSVLGADAFKRFMQVTSELDRLRKEAKLPRFWHAFSIGVDPKQRGAGFGGALMAKTFQVSDSDGCPCYLETFSDRNVAIHGKHGYRVVTEGTVPNTALRFWTMLRPVGGRVAEVGAAASTP